VPHLEDTAPLALSSSQGRQGLWLQRPLLPLTTNAAPCSAPAAC